MKFGQLIVDKIRNILRDKYTQNVVEKLILDPIYK